MVKPQARLGGALGSVMLADGLGAVNARQANTQSSATSSTRQGQERMDPTGREPSKIFPLEESEWFKCHIVARPWQKYMKPSLEERPRGCVQISVAVFLALRDQAAS